MKRILVVLCILTLVGAIAMGNFFSNARAGNGGPRPFLVERGMALEDVSKKLVEE